MIDLKQLEVWFVTGSQSLYGEKTLAQVAEHSRAMARGLGQRLGVSLRCQGNDLAGLPWETTHGGATSTGPSGRNSMSCSVAASRNVSG